MTWKAFRNLPEVHVITPGELNTYDVLVSDYLLFTPDTLPGSGSPGARRDGEDETAAVGQGPHVAEEAGVSGGPGARRASDETAAVGQEQVDDEEAEA